MSSNIDPEFTELMESKDFTLFERWKNAEEKNPGAEAERYLEDWPKYQE
jgi:hypothetical protein